MPQLTSPVVLNANGIPDFDYLPIRKDDPKWSAWGLYGPEDQLGTLNRLTNERVAAAAASIKTGERYIGFPPFRQLPGPHLPF